MKITIQEAGQLASLAAGIMIAASASAASATGIGDKANVRWPASVNESAPAHDSEQPAPREHTVGATGGEVRVGQSTGDTRISTFPSSVNESAPAQTGRE